MMNNELLRLYLKNHSSLFYIPILVLGAFVSLRFYFLGYVEDKQIFIGLSLLLLSTLFFANQQRIYKNILRSDGEEIGFSSVLTIMLNKACYIIPWLLIIFWPYQTGYFFDQFLGFIIVFLTIGFYSSVSAPSLILLAYDMSLQFIFTVIGLFLNWSNVEAPYILIGLSLFTSYSLWVGLKLNKSVKELVHKNKQLQIKTDEAKKANRAKSDFLAMISHEIRTPLFGITGTVESLHDTRLTKVQSEALGVVSRCSSILLSMLNDVLDFSKIEVQKLTIEEMTFDLKSLISDVVSNNESAAKNKKLYLKYDLENVPQFITSDYIRIHQVIVNLVSNAIKFTEVGGVQFNVSFQEPDQILTIKIQDTGIGIAKDNIERLFTPFEQEEQSTARHFGGTGLGLSIVKELVTLMNGNIHVSSEKGKGSIFTVNLPVVVPISDEDVSGREDQDDGVELTLQGMSVLIVEDNLINQMHIAKTLDKYLCSYDVVSDGKEALEKVKKNAYDVILMDMNMPNMNGIEATTKIKKKNINTPIIGLSAVTQKEILDKFYLAGITEHIVKPFTRENLLSMILRYRSIDDAPLREKIDQIYEDFTPSFCQKLTLGSFDEIQKLYAHLEDDLKENNVEKIDQYAHEICGVAGNIGMYKTYEQSKLIEEICLKQHDVSAVLLKAKALKQMIEAEMTLVQNYIKNK